MGVTDGIKILDDYNPGLGKIKSPEQQAAELVAFKKRVIKRLAKTKRAKQARRRQRLAAKR